jgi:hypothetical protein
MDNMEERQFELWKDLDNMEERQVELWNVAVWKSTGKKYRKMECFITSCTRIASNVVFQTLQF